MLNRRDTAQARGFAFQLVGLLSERLRFIAPRNGHVCADLEIFEARVSVPEFSEADFTVGNIDLVHVDEQMAVDVAEQARLLDPDFDVVPVAPTVMFAGCR